MWSYHSSRVGPVLWRSPAVPLNMSGCAYLLDFGADVDDVLIGDVRLRLLVGKQFVGCLQTFPSVVNLAGSLGDALGLFAFLGLGDFRLVDELNLLDFLLDGGVVRFLLDGGKWTCPIEILAVC